METVVNQHGLDIEALTSPRLPHAGGSSTQMEDSGSAHIAGIFIYLFSLLEFCFFFLM